MEIIVLMAKGLSLMLHLLPICFKLFIARLCIWVYPEYLMMSHYLPRCPKKELIWPISAIYLIEPTIVILLMLVSGVLMAFVIVIFGKGGFGRSAISIYTLAFIPSCYAIFFIYKIRKFIFKDQFHRKNWQELGITWEQCKGAIWRSWIFSILVGLSLILVATASVWEERFGGKSDFRYTDDNGRRYIDFHGRRYIEFGGHSCEVDINTIKSLKNE